MPAETVLVVSFIVAVFAVFGVLLGWATAIAGPAFPGYGRTPTAGTRRDGSVALAH